MPNVIMEQLRTIPLFAGLRKEELREVARLVKKKSYQAGDRVCRQGDEGHSLYYIERGELRVLHVDAQGIEREVRHLGPGEYFGETSLLLGEPRDATVVAVQDTTVLALHRDDFEPFLRKHPDAIKRLKMSRVVAHKYRARRANFKWLDPDERVLVSSHRHDVMLYRILFTPFLLFLVTTAGCLYVLVARWNPLLLLIGAIIDLILVVLIVLLYADHRDEIYIVTNKRVARRFHTPLGKESRIDAPLQNIQDVQELQTGLLAQLYNFGDLIIETAGERGHLAFREIPDPAGVRKIIFEQITRLQAGAKVREREMIRDDLRRYIETQAAPVPVVQPEQEEAGPQPASRRSLLSTWLRKSLRFLLPPLWDVHGETITWRKHWIALIRPITPPTLLGLLTTGLAIFLLIRFPGLAFPILIGYGIVTAVVLGWWLWVFDDWQNDIYQVTSSRIIDIERSPLFLRENRREASLGAIQNVKFEVPSLLGKLLDYGSVTIETAGAGAFTFDHVKDPSGVQAEIFRRMEAFRKRQQQIAAERHRTELLDWFTVYDQLRKEVSTKSSPSS
ncbi:MAG: cyclic nucleotide-binding domain-containing protein [Anaerolineae bacterium]|nr:cyclic nucleotide-binding domain-containing protein [Anaerolineae bacterium]